VQPQKHAYSGDVLLSVRAPVGPTNIANIKCCIGRGLAALRPLADTPTEYILLVMRAFQNILESFATGTTFGAVSKQDIEDLIIDVSPLAEQHRIVAKVDELMALCDQLERQTEDSITAHQTLVETLLAGLTESKDAEEFAQNWRRLAEHFDTLFTTEHSIDQFKQTILQLAVMGKLVPQDPNDEPASILLEKIAAEKARMVKEGKIKKQKPLPEIGVAEILNALPQRWEMSRLGVFTSVGTGSTPARDKSAYYSSPEINWVTSGETSQDFITETKEKISPLAVEETNVSVFPKGSLIIAMYGQGKTRGQVTELMIEAGTNQACAAVVLINKEIAHRKYLKLFFKKAYDELRSHAAGGAQPNLNVGKISKTVIPLPPLNEQHRIVAKVNELMALCDQLKAHLRDAQIIQTHLADTIVEQAVV
jgi:type I restriction enzyme, S subunit